MGRGHRQPRVTPEAPVPAQAIRLTDHEVILEAHLGRIGADELVAVKPQPMSSQRSLGESAWSVRCPATLASASGTPGVLRQLRRGRSMR